MKRILRHLLRGLGSGKHPVKDTENQAAVAVVELAERLGVARGYAFYELHIVRLVGDYDTARPAG